MMETRRPFNVELNDQQDYQRLMQTPQTLGMKVGRVFLGPGDECGKHSTEAREESLVFLQGKGQLVLGQSGKERMLVGKGKVTYVPPHTEHNIVNTGSEPLVYIYCAAPVK